MDCNQYLCENKVYDKSTFRKKMLHFRNSEGEGGPNYIKLAHCKDSDDKYNSEPICNENFIPIGSKTSSPILYDYNHIPASELHLMINKNMSEHKTTITYLFNLDKQLKKIKEQINSYEQNIIANRFDYNDRVSDRIKIEQIINKHEKSLKNMFVFNKLKIKQNIYDENLKLMAINDRILYLNNDYTKRNLALKSLKELIDTTNNLRNQFENLLKTYSVKVFKMKEALEKQAEFAKQAEIIRKQEQAQAEELAKKQSIAQKQQQEYDRVMKQQQQYDYVMKQQQQYDRVMKQREQQKMDDIKQKEQKEKEQKEQKEKEQKEKEQKEKEQKADNIKKTHHKPSPPLSPESIDYPLDKRCPNGRTRNKTTGKCIKNNKSKKK